jgi:FlaG/FlaF family flagellin (archaellin)
LKSDAVRPELQPDCINMLLDLRENHGPHTKTTSTKKCQIALFLEALQDPSNESQQTKTIRLTYLMR